MAERSSQYQQKGIAIITVLLVIALATITIASMVSHQQLDIRREMNEAFIHQARSLGVSGERFAAAVLFRDVKDGARSNSDSLDDDWAQTLPPVPIDNAAIQGCIVDMQGKFNLNNMIDGEGAMYEPAVTQFRELLKQLNINDTKADAVVDWIDKDVNPMTDGAEDDYYSGLETPYGTSNTSFISVSELQLVKGFSPAIEEELADYELLLPHVAALPGFTPVNVNTATPEVLGSLLLEEFKPVATSLSRWDTTAYQDYPECEDLFDLEAEAVSGLAQGANLDPYESTLDFESEADPGGGDQVAQPGSYDVKSQYFQVRIDISTEAVNLVQYTLLWRDNSGKTKVIYRSRDTL